MDKSGSLNLIDIVGQYVQLTQVSDSHFSGRCPFCSSDEDSLIVSLENQYWSCLSCDADGDKYDFVAKSENIGRAAAILMVGHHANSGTPLPHARFKLATPAAKIAGTAESQRTVTTESASSEAAPPEPAEAKITTSRPQGSTEQSLLSPLLGFRNIVPSYQGAAILDGESKMIVCDSEYPASAELADIGKMLSPILMHTEALFSKWGMNASIPATLTLASESLAFVVHKSGPANKLMQLVVRLENPSDVPVARRLVVSASAKFS